MSIIYLPCRDVKFTLLCSCPYNSDLNSREVLDIYLSRALNIDLSIAGRLGVIDDCAYVLTLDYTLKMLNIHERYKCGEPVIIQGETGVGKTALVEMLSRLWNQSLMLEWNKHKERLFDFFIMKVSELVISRNYEVS